MSTTNEFFDMQAAPMRIGTVRLKVRDLDGTAAFYRQLFDLDTIETGDRRVVLGNGATPLLELLGDPGLSPADRRHAGLFHVAFLMPTRADLARWLIRVIQSGTPLQGASDHIVSEALYLSDPEGNGIEVYVDRPTARWLDRNGNIQMATEALDVQDLIDSAGDSVWQGFPEGGSIGHVHLQVGDTAEADRFYRDVLGFGVTVDYPGASFYGSGGYHHHLAGNIWNSRRAGVRSGDMAGLDAVEIVVGNDADREAIVRRAEAAGIPVLRDGAAIILRDPWGTRINLTQ